MQHCTICTILRPARSWANPAIVEPSCAARSAGQAVELFSVGLLERALLWALGFRVFGKGLAVLIGPMLFDLQGQVTT